MVSSFVDQLVYLKHSAVSEEILSFAFTQRHITIIHEMLLVWSGGESPRLYEAPAQLALLHIPSVLNSLCQFADFKVGVIWLLALVPSTLHTVRIN